MIRLQKALADRGVASRRRAEELIASGRVRVNGAPVTMLGTKVAPDARIDVDGVQTVSATPRYLLLNKPRGIVSSANDERGRRTVVDLIGARERLYPVGRLDTDSEGMLLLTNDGEWAQRVLHPRFGHEREYDVAVSGELTSAALAQLASGVRLEEGLARARVEVRSRSRRESRLRMVLHTGWRRQIRRMLSAVGLRTVRLVRVRIGSLAMGKLKPGEWRELTKAEVAALARPAADAARRARVGRESGAGALATRARADDAPTAAPRGAFSRRALAPSAKTSGRPPRPTRLLAGRRVANSEERGRRPEKAPPSRRFGSRVAFADAQPRTRRGADPVAPQRTARPTARRGRRPPIYGATRGPVRARVRPR